MSVQGLQGSRGLCVGARLRAGGCGCRVEGVALNLMQPTLQPMCSYFAPTAAKEETVLFLDHINSHAFPLYMPIHLVTVSKSN